MQVESRMMYCGFAGGIKLMDGRSIYWNQHLHVPPLHGNYKKHTTTQIRVGNAQSRIVANIRTYIDRPNDDIFKLEQGAQAIPQELLTWAEDAHDTYTNNHLELDSPFDCP